jgi:hypothetical protein
MDVEAFRTLCANTNIDADILHALVEARRKGPIPPDEKRQILSILRDTGHAKLAAKVELYHERFRKFS